ncbi:hypothetical protein BDV06DRAFT_217706 [Aspergillus oleicola]
MEKVKDNDKRSTRFELGQALRSQSNSSHQAPSPPSLLLPPPCEPRSNGLAKGSPRKKPRGKIIRGSPKAFALAKITKLGHNASSELHVWNESPWSTFKVSYECDLAGPAYVCVRCSGSRAVRAIYQIFYPLTLGHVIACKAFPDQ